MTRKLQSKSLIFFFAFCFSNILWAEDTKPLEDSLEKQFIQTNITVSNWLDRMAEKIDLFLVGKKVSTKKNETQVKIQSSSFSTEGHQVVNSFSFGFNPRFPNLEEFLQLKFTTNEDRNDPRKGVSESSNVHQTEKNYSTSSSLFKALGRVQTTFQPRISLGNPLKVSHSLNFEMAEKLKTTIINPKLEFFADADRGVGVYNALNFQFPLSSVFSLVLVNDGEYLDKEHTYTVNNGFSLGQIINDRVDFAYSLIFTSLNQPSYHLENYVFAFAWNEQYYKRILNLQFIPQLDFQKVNHYKGSAGFTFNITLIF
jgi:hypothetical protein